MQLFDEGVFLNGASETVSCRSLIVVATSNAGADVWKSPAVGYPARWPGATPRRALEAALRNHFRVELLNRFDRIIPFAPLSEEDVRAIAQREVEGLARRTGCERRGLVLVIDPELVDWVAAEGFDVELGARPLRRAVERRIATALARTIVREDPAPGTRVRLGLEKGRGCVRVLDR